jgi:hypothetical protein
MAFPVTYFRRSYDAFPRSDLCTLAFLIAQKVQSSHKKFVHGTRIIESIGERAYLPHLFASELYPFKRSTSLSVVFYLTSPSDLLDFATFVIA